ncbi:MULTISPECIES: hypothetical protein [Enterococcus]|nr:MULTISPECIES: hypothetical protein [Enterococcus]DAJ20906.1 MAG TPA: hypothetical protein [Siphoviridae sp. ctekg1]MBK4763823.1 hypothetical protein [Enterococcus faecium]MDQ8364413.1 hypothetical protein [Enterococcus faecium]MDW2984595.1 hypothetical protein [Enterococcus faecium]MDW3030662.1 hypothetical protein [Enterococcus faecium]
MLAFKPSWLLETEENSKITRIYLVTKFNGNKVSKRAIVNIHK